MVSCPQMVVLITFQAHLGQRAVDKDSGDVEKDSLEVSGLRRPWSSTIPAALTKRSPTNPDQFTVFLGGSISIGDSTLVIISG